jgi:hypothetical protein
MGMARRGRGSRRGERRIAIAESVMRSVHSPPHHARSSVVAKHHNDAPGRTSSKRAECAHARRIGLRRARPRCVARCCGPVPASGRSRARRGTSGRRHSHRGVRLHRACTRASSLAARQRGRPGAGARGARARRRMCRHSCRERRGRQRSTLLGAGEARREIGGLVVDGAPLVRPRYALVVTVRVGHRSSVRRRRLPRKGQMAAGTHRWTARRPTSA